MYILYIYIYIYIDYIDINMFGNEGFPVASDQVRLLESLFFNGSPCAKEKLMTRQGAEATYHPMGELCTPKVCGIAGDATSRAHHSRYPHHQPISHPHPHPHPHHHHQNPNTSGCS